MNHYEDGRSERQEDIKSLDSSQQPIKEQPVLPLSVMGSNLRSEFRSAIACARYIVSTFIEENIDQLNEMRGRLDEPFFNEDSSIEERAIVLGGMAEALRTIVEVEGTPRQIANIFEAARQILGHLGAHDPALKDTHERFSEIIVQLLGVENEELGSEDLIKSSDHRATLFQVVERLLSLPSLTKSKHREQLETIIVSNMATINDQFNNTESLNEVGISELTLIEALAACCEATKNSFFDESLSALFYTLSEYIELGEFDEEEDDNLIDHEWTEAEEDECEEVEEELDEEDAFELTAEHAMSAILRALVVCQNGNTQEMLWKKLLELFETVDESWGIALAGISMVEPDFVYPHIKKLLEESANYELRHVPRSDEDSSVSQHFTVLLDLLAVNRAILPGLTEAMDALNSRQQKAIARVFRQAVDRGEVNFSYSYNSHEANEDFEGMIEKVLVRH